MREQSGGTVEAVGSGGSGVDLFSGLSFLGDT
jgi:hypothetical protein